MRRIPGEGPQNARCMFIGEQPGIVEMKRGRPFVGPAGQELNRFLNGYVLPNRQDVYLTNWRSEPVPKGEDWSVPLADTEAIQDEIHRVRPQIIVTLGAHITQFFLGDVTMEAVHGIPHFTPDTEAPWAETPIFPCYNPAAALHSPRLQAQFAYDMTRLGLFLKGKLAAPPIDERPGTYIDASGSPIQWQLPSGARPSLIAVDTEGWLHAPWCASLSTAPYHGLVTRHNSFGWKKLVEYVQFYTPTIVLHSALHDLAMLRVMGLDLDELGVQVDDTMVMAYLLGLEPQGLKPLAYRHAGATHQDYSDVVEIPNQAEAEMWLWNLVNGLPEQVSSLRLTAKQLRALPAAEVAMYDANCAAAKASQRNPLSRARLLITAMLEKNDPQTLRTRWGACRAREILVEEESYLQPWDGDPPEATLDTVPLQTAVDYAGRDADLTLRVYHSLRPQITAMGLEDAYAADIAILPMVDRMQAVGIEADLEHFRGLVEMLTVEQQMNLEALAQLAGRPLNPNSGDQVAAWIYDELMLQDQVPNLRIKRTDSGARLSTNGKVLEALEGTHPGIALIMDGREIGKIKGTYAEAIPLLVGRDGRLHPTLRITRAETGRLTAADPNILALPKHSDRGKLIRDGFKAGPGRVLGEWDLDQIEMRVFANDSQDEVMIAAFLAGKDFHADTGARISGRTYEELLKAFLAYKLHHDHKMAWADAERFAAKAVNFGILMGITAYGLLAQFHKNGQLHWTLEMCEQLLADWHRTYPQGSAYIKSKHAEARRYGYIRDMWGRLRYVEGIHSSDPYIVAEAERQAQATPTQSGATGIMKRAMAVLWPYLKSMRAGGIWVECLLVLHDALMLEYDPAHEELIDSAVMAALCETVKLSIPITAKAKKGVQRWGEL